MTGGGGIPRVEGPSEGFRGGGDAGVGNWHGWGRKRVGWVEKEHQARGRVEAGVDGRREKDRRTVLEMKGVAKDELCRVQMEFPCGRYCMHCKFAGGRNNKNDT